MREAAARDDHPAEADADHSFHHAIVKASGNRMLEHVWQTMRLSITTCLTVSITHRSLHEIAERHVAVLEALRSGDPDRAEAAIRATSRSPASGLAPHISRSRPRVLPSRTRRKRRRGGRGEDSPSALDLGCVGLDKGWGVGLRSVRFGCVGCRRRVSLLAFRLTPRAPSVSSVRQRERDVAGRRRDSLRLWPLARRRRVAGDRHQQCTAGRRSGTSSGRREWRRRAPATSTAACRCRRRRRAVGCRRLERRSARQTRR